MDEDELRMVKGRIVQETWPEQIVFFHKERGHNMIDSIISWVKARLAERTSWDGIVLVAVGLVVLLLGPYAKIAAIAAIIWGAFTILKKERPDLLDKVGL